MNKRSPHDPLAANAMHGDLKALKKKMEAEEEARKADLKARVAAGKAKAPPVVKAVVPVKKRVDEVWRPELEARLFEVAMSGVRPLEAAKSARITQADPAARPRAERPTAEAAERRRRAEGGPSIYLAWQPDGTVRASHRGREFALEALERFASPEAQLDLHGLDAVSARARVADFVRAKRARKARSVCIVTGYGKNSPDGASVLLDAAVAELSSAPTSGELDAFVSAPENLGGRGAILVALRA